MKRYFDVGYHHGESLGWFREQYSINDQWLIYCFEPNPNNHKHFTTAPNIINFPLAAWLFDGTVSLHQHDTGDGRLDGDASSILLDWQVPGMVSSVEVPCTDFPELLLFLGEPGDFVVVKLDIEGAEYGVCRRLIETGAVNRISRLHVEFHQRFMATESDDTTDALRSELARYTEVIDHW